MRRLLIKSLLLSAAVLPVLASAADYPERPIRLIVPFGAGSSGDVVGRQVAEALGTRLKQTIVVENKPGSGTAIGASSVAKSAADGYTLLLGTNATHASNKALYPKLQYDPLKDFEPAAFVGLVPSALVVSAESPYKTLADFVARAKANPGGVSYASSGNGTTGHLAGEMLATMAKVKLLHVPFKEGAQGVTGVLARDIDAILIPPSAVMSLISSGRLRALGVSTLRRSPSLPNIPTIAEQGHPGYDVVGWYSISAPAGTPAAIVQKINAEMRALVADSAFAKKLMELGLETRPMSTQELVAFFKSEEAKAAHLIRQSGAVID
jgi:tripartite-type tricarboxylate transporter receptor subunit TctC